MKLDRRKRKYIIGLRMAGLFAVVLALSCDRPKTTHYFPEVGGDAIAQRVRELRSDLNVMSIALEPGYEDLAALAYYRLGEGAKIMSAYLTNGEAGESDVRGEYPDYLAATRRLEADAALFYLEGEAHFLNFVGIIAARDSAFVREKWPAAEVQRKLMDLLNKFKPDVVLLGRDWLFGSESHRWKTLKHDIVAALRRLSTSSDNNGGSNWKDVKLLADVPETPGEKLPVDKRHPRFGKRYTEIAAEAAASYRSLRVQRRNLMHGKAASYSILVPSPSLRLSELDVGNSARHSKDLKWLNHGIERLAQEVEESDKASALTSMIAILDSVNTKIASRYRFSIKDQRTLFHWKNALDRLRCSLLGVRVDYAVSDSVLTMRQLTYLTINNVEGIVEEGKTTVFFGGLDDWIINEGFEKKFPYKPGESYRLLTPSELELTTPHGRYGLQASQVSEPVMFFIIHRPAEREKTFIHRSVLKLRFAPKFATEVLTPVVRMVPDENVIVRFTNFSRDGVKDTVRTIHELAESTSGAFRINQKDGVHLDTLGLRWKKDVGGVKDGTHLMPLEVRGFRVGNFAVRKFAVEVRGDRRVGWLSGVKESPIGNALRRLGLKSVEIVAEKDLSNRLANLDVLIVDRRALTLKDKIRDRKKELDRFVANGGHLIYLSQDAEPWQHAGMLAGISLQPSHLFDERTPVEIDAVHPLTSAPNRITSDDWNDWLYLRAFNKIETEAGHGFEIPVRANIGGRALPLVLTKGKGNGRVTYVDLALHPQLLNVHPGTFRLLANLISMEESKI